MLSQEYLQRQIVEIIFKVLIRELREFYYLFFVYIYSHADKTKKEKCVLHLDLFIKEILIHGKNKKKLGLLHLLYFIFKFYLQERKSKERWNNTFLYSVWDPRKTPLSKFPHEMVANDQILLFLFSLFFYLLCFLSLFLCLFFFSFFNMRENCESGVRFVR